MCVCACVYVHVYVCIEARGYMPHMAKVKQPCRNINTVYNRAFIFLMLILYLMLFYF